MINKLKGTLQHVLLTHQSRVAARLSQKLEDLQATSSKADILAWLKTTDPEQNHKVARAKREPYTCT